MLGNICYPHMVDRVGHKSQKRTREVREIHNLVQLRVI